MTSCYRKAIKTSFDLLVIKLNSIKELKGGLYEKFLSLTLALLMVVSLLSGCAKEAPAPAETQSEVENYCSSTEMSNEELFKKAIEESNGKVMYGIGNSSRGATAGTNFIEALKAIDPSYTGTIEWSQPKDNSIFTLLSADINSSTHTYSMTLIQDGNQIQSKMLNTGYLKNFIPKDWLGRRK